MKQWLNRLFLRKSLIETYNHNDDCTLKRQRVEDIQYGGGGLGLRRFTHPAGTINLKQYRYWCPCGTELTDGPTGGCAVNAVCKKCRINYGNLPGYWGQ